MAEARIRAGKEDDELEIYCSTRNYGDSQNIIFQKDTREILRSFYWPNMGLTKYVIFYF